MPNALTLQVASYPRCSWLLLFRFVKRPLLFLGLSAGLWLGAFPFTSTTAVASSVEASTSSRLGDGTYVFGESPEVGQFGVTYMVFSVQSQQIVGAFYQPSSSFDCFHGEIVGNEMALTVVDSYSQTPHPYALALDTSGQSASQDGTVGAFVPRGFHPIAELSDVDQDVLAMCQTVQTL